MYGYPCIVTAISERLFITTSCANDIPTDTRFVDAAIQEWGEGKSAKFSIKSTFSGKYGFGSSSAVTVATLKALKPDSPDRMLFDTAYKIILEIQGVGSGFDVASAVFGGTLYYIKNLPRRQAGKTIEPLIIKNMPLVVGYTGVKSNTVDLIKMVAKKREEYPEKVERICKAIGKIVDEAKSKIIEGPARNASASVAGGDWERVGRLMDFNQEYLRDLGVSSEKLEALIAAAKNAGAYGAKLSGAGGGDCMIALASPDKRKAVEEAITKAGGEVVHVKPNAQGVRIETTDNQDELFIVVDRNDNILGYKTRWECHHDPSRIHRAVGVVIFDDVGRVLLQKRSMTKDMEPGLWSISSAGHVTKGQTDEEAARRELKEELGIDAPLTFWKKFISEEPDETERDVVYKSISSGPFHPNTEEVAEVRFFEIRELKLHIASRRIQLTAGSTKTLHEVGIL